MRQKPIFCPRATGVPASLVSVASSTFGQWKCWWHSLQRTKHQAESEKLHAEAKHALVVENGLICVVVGVADDLVTQTHTHTLSEAKESAGTTEESGPGRRCPCC